MKGLYVALSLLYCVVALPSPQPSRLYFPEEEDPYRISTLTIIDSKGNLRQENLLEPHPYSVGVPANVTFNLYTQKNPIEGDVVRGDNHDDILASSNFDPSKDIVFFTHGWTDSETASLPQNVKDALVAKHDVNVFLVDWSGLADEFYTGAYSNVPRIGEFIGDFVDYLIGTYGLTSSNFKLMGHSLGAQISGCAGAKIRETNGLVNFIIGFDPAGPLFTIDNIDNRLDITDAEFVQVIHTNGGLLGFKSSMGHADFYPNGGSDQPGCGDDLLGRCAHIRVIPFYVESVLTSGFVSRKCSDWATYELGDCDGNEIALMGEYDLDKTISGDYFLRTAESEPFALN